MRKIAGARRIEVGRALERTFQECNVDDRRARDPVSHVHSFEDPLDRELVGLLASSMAFGSVVVIHRKIGEVLSLLGGRPMDATSDLDALRKKLIRFKHRVFKGDDVARLLFGARTLQRRDGSLGATFGSALRDQGLDRFVEGKSTPVEGDYERLREAIRAFSSDLRAAAGLRSGRRRGPAHLLPNAEGAGAMKRFLLFLRWMVRPDDGIDCGLWPVDPALLVCPVDVHIHRLARNLGWTDRRTADWATALDVTRALRAYRPSDPVAYDFALCHLGMLQGCPSRRDPVRCEGCGIQSVCRHWAPRSP